MMKIHIIFYQFDFMDQEKFKVKRVQLENSQQWKKQLTQIGAVVIKSIISKQQVAKVQQLFWDYLTSLGTQIDRKDSETWDNANWPANTENGFFTPCGGNHTHASWYLRCHPRVQQVFKRFWGTQELITSFDTVIGWRPYWVDQDWETQTLSLHLDQNPYYKKGFHCIQGMIPLRDVGEDSAGGLQIVPRSNSQQQVLRIIQTHPGVKGYKDDFVVINFNDPFQKQKVLVQCEAGDYILWDSRTAHSARKMEPSQEFKEKYQNDLIRLSFTITMLPRSSASKEVLERRRIGFENRVGTTHWANQYISTIAPITARNIKIEQITYKWPQLTPQIEKLI